MRQRCGRFAVDSALSHVVKSAGGRTVRRCRYAAGAESGLLPVPRPRVEVHFSRTLTIIGKVDAKRIAFVVAYLLPRVSSRDAGVSQQRGEGRNVGKVCRGFFRASSQGRLTRLVTPQWSITMVPTGCKTNRNLVLRHVLPSPAPVLRSSRVRPTYSSANPRIHYHPERNRQHRTQHVPLQ
jgi:hypothetical protein